MASEPSVLTEPSDKFRWIVKHGDYCAAVNRRVRIYYKTPERMEKATFTVDETHGSPDSLMDANVWLRPIEADADVTNDDRCDMYFTAQSETTLIRYMHVEGNGHLNCVVHSILLAD